MVCVGIDLGTTFSCVAIIDEDDKPVSIANLSGNIIT